VLVLRLSLGQAVLQSRAGPSLMGPRRWLSDQSEGGAVSSDVAPAGISYGFSYRVRLPARQTTIGPPVDSWPPWTGPAP
jgi:hypothetical protein